MLRWDSTRLMSKMCGKSPVIQSGPVTLTNHTLDDSAMPAYNGSAALRDTCRQTIQDVVAAVNHPNLSSRKEQTR